MAYVTGSRLYAVINKATLRCGLLKFGFGYESPSSEPVPEIDSDNLVQVLSPEVLGELTPEDFLAQKIPVLEDGIFVEWGDRPEPGELTLGVNGTVKDDLSNFATVVVTGGPPNGEFRVVFNRAVSTNLPESTGSFNGAGAGTFKVKALGAGDITFTVQVEGYFNANGTIQVVPGEF